MRTVTEILFAKARESLHPVVSGRIDRGWSGSEHLKSTIVAVESEPWSRKRVAVPMNAGRG